MYVMPNSLVGIATLFYLVFFIFLHLNFLFRLVVCRYYTTYINGKRVHELISLNYCYFYHGTFNLAYGAVIILKKNSKPRFLGTF